jgi:hypothetical protein
VGRRDDVLVRPEFRAENYHSGLGMLSELEVEGKEVWQLLHVKSVVAKAWWNQFTGWSSGILRHRRLPNDPATITLEAVDSQRMEPRL